MAFNLGRRSNWEVIAFVLINEITSPNLKNKFTRSQLMTTHNIDMAVSILSKLCGLKKHPEHPKETLQRTIQNLRDKGFIIFHGEGVYQLTDLGTKELNEIQKRNQDQQGECLPKL